MKLRHHITPDRTYTSFWCPGCQRLHQIVTAGPGAWEFDGNDDAPTFAPSVLVTYNGADADRDGRPRSRCHSFVRGGMIEFLTDSTHDMGGQTVPLPDFPQ